MNANKKLSLLLSVALGLPVFAGCNSPDKIIDSVTIPVTDPTPTPTPSTTPSPKPTVTPTPTPSSTPSTSLYTGPASVAKYVQKFVDDAKAQGVNVLPYMKNPKLVIQIASLDAWGASTIGLCQSSSTQRKLTVDPDFWNTASDTRREILMHHELGHCVLDRRHRTTKLSSGLYASVMYPIIMSSSAYNNNYRYYQDELFSSSYIGWNALMSGTYALNGTEDARVDICDLPADPDE